MRDLSLSTKLGSSTNVGQESSVTSGGFLRSRPVGNVLLVYPAVLILSFQTLKMPLGLKYACPSESTWKLAVASLLKVLSIGLPVARQHASSGKFETMWPELANAFEDFLFTKRYKTFFFF